jgi:sn1-specific diacylglycerol lipase
MSGTNVELVYMTLENCNLKKPYNIIVDHGEKTVIVGLRGTWSLEDAMTDLLLSPLEMSEAGTGRWGFEGKGRHAHGGFLRAALWVRENIFDRGTLDILLNSRSDTKGYGLVVTGHSLGAALASIVTLLLRHEFPQVEGIVYACPASIFDAITADECIPFITAVGIDNDWVCMTSWEGVSELRAEVLDAISRARTNKMKCLRSVLKDYSDSRPDALMYPKGSAPDSKFKTELDAALSIPNGKHVSLFTPGRILFAKRTITRVSGGWFGDWFGRIQKREYRFQVQRKEKFKKVRLTPGMFFDHFPDFYMKNIKNIYSELVEERNTYLD